MKCLAGLVILESINFVSSDWYSSWEFLQLGRSWSVWIFKPLFIKEIFQSSSFMLPEVEFWCSPPELNVPRGKPINWTSPISPGEEKPESCLMYDFAYENVTEETIQIDGAGVIPCSRWDYSRSKSPESVASQFNLVCGNDYLRSLSQSLYMAGKMVGALGSGMLSDKFGR